MPDDPFEGYAVVELLGHRSLLGQCCEIDLCGAKVLRVDIALPDGRSWPYLATAASLYGISPTTAAAITDDRRRENQANLVRWGLATPEERADYESFVEAERQRERERYAQMRGRLLDAPAELDFEDANDGR